MIGDWGLVIGNWQLVTGDLFDFSGFAFMNLAADSGIFFEAAIPGEAGDGVSEGHPKSLDEQAAD